MGAARNRVRRTPPVAAGNEQSATRVVYGDPGATRSVLTRTKAPADVLVIDKAEKPSAN